MNAIAQTAEAPEVDVSRAAEGGEWGGAVVIAIAFVAALYLYRKYFPKRRDGEQPSCGCAGCGCRSCAVNPKRNQFRTRKINTGKEDRDGFPTNRRAAPCRPMKRVWLSFASENHFRVVSKPGVRYRAAVVVGSCGDGNRDAAHRIADVLRENGLGVDVVDHATVHNPTRFYGHYDLLVFGRFRPVFPGVTAAKTPAPRSMFSTVSVWMAKKWRSSPTRRDATRTYRPPSIRSRTCSRHAVGR